MLFGDMDNIKHDNGINDSDFLDFRLLNMNKQNTIGKCILTIQTPTERVSLSNACHWLVKSMKPKETTDQL